MSGKYSIIYADPCWRFQVWDEDTGMGRSPDAHYETLTADEMIPLKPEAARDAILVMWVYDPMLPDALHLANGWGFKFCTVLFRWIKTTEHPGQLSLMPIELPTTPMGLGHHTRAGGCEEAWLFKRGRGLPVLRHDIRREFYALVREHSRKPDEVADWIVDLYGDVPRLEMFTRTRRPGWDVMGKEIDKFASVSA